MLYFTGLLQAMTPSRGVTVLLALVIMASSVGPLPLAAAAQGPASTFTVNSTADVVDAAPGDGQCRTGAGSCTLRAAIQEGNAQHAGATVRLPAGTYRLTIAGSEEDQAATGDLDIRADMALIGASASSTTIDAGNLDRILHVVGASNVHVSGVTISNGSAGAGCGIFNSGTLTLTRVVVSNNRCDTRGGGIFSADGSRLRLEATTVSNNGAGVDSGPGGGIYTTGAAVELVGSSVRGNLANTAAGIDAHGGKLTLTNTTIQGNNALFAGGIRFEGGDFRMDGGLIAENRGADGIGGGLALSNVNAVLEGVTVRNNEGFQRGGGIALDGGSATLRQVSLVGNSSFTGGAALDGQGLMTVEASTISQNGSALSATVNWLGTATFRNTTISGNNSIEGAISGAVVVMEHVTLTDTPGLGSTLTVRDTILAGGCDGFSSIISRGHNLEPGTACGLHGPGDLSNADPRLGPLADNGGPTRTHALLPGSPAIDASTNSGCPASDQRGVRRPQDGNGDGVSICDIGAFEKLGSQIVDCTTTIRGAHRSLVVQPGGTTCLLNTQVTGSVRVLPGARVLIGHSTIGAISAEAPALFEICSTLVRGALVLRQATGFVLIGDPVDDDCDENTINGAVLLHNNHGDVEIAHNHIGGTLALIETTGTGPFVEDTRAELEHNVIGGALVCRGNVPAPTNDGRPNTVTGTKSGQCAGL